MHGLVELVGIGRKTLGDCQHQPRHKHHAQQGESGQKSQQNRQNATGEFERRGQAFGFQTLRKQRHESSVKCTLGKQAAKQVRQAKGDDENLSQRASPHQGGDKNIAHEASDAADHGGRADNRRGFYDAAGRAPIAYFLRRLSGFRQLSTPRYARPSARERLLLGLGGCATCARVIAVFRQTGLAHKKHPMPVRQMSPRARR